MEGMGKSKKDAKLHASKALLVHLHKVKCRCGIQKYVYFGRHFNFNILFHFHNNIIRNCDTCIKFRSPRSPKNRKGRNS